MTIKRRKYPHGVPDAWVKPVRRGYRAACCDCGLVHSYNYRLVKNGKRGFQIQFQVSRNDRATSAIRRYMKIGEWTELLYAIRRKVGRGKVPVLITIRKRTRYESRKKKR